MNPRKVDRRLSADREPAARRRLRAAATRSRTSPFRTTTARSSGRMLRCVGLGECRKHDSGTMCPSYMVTLEEEHSTRGRAHMLFELLQGEVVSGGWKDEHVKRSLDLCLSCKACKSECPANVDMATYRAEFLSHYYEGRSRPLNAYAFGMVDRWLELAAIAPRLANFARRRAVAQPDHAPRPAPRAGTAAAQSGAAELPEVGATKWCSDVSSARSGTARPQRRHSVGGHVQQPLSPGDEPGRAARPAGGGIRRGDSRSAAVLRAAALRLRHARSGQAVSADRHGFARRRHRCRRADRRARAELRIGVSRRAAQPVSQRRAGDATSQPDVSPFGAPRIPRRSPTSRRGSRERSCSTVTAITKRS